MFEEPFFIDIVDWGHSTPEKTRFLGFAPVGNFSVVVSCFTERTTGRIRIISARRTTSVERREYYERLREIYN